MNNFDGCSLEEDLNPELEFLRAFVMITLILTVVCLFVSILSLYDPIKFY